MTMRIKPGQIVRFQTPMAGEDPEQQYVVLEWHDNAEPPRAKIKALGTGLPFPPISVVSADTLETVEAATSDLLGTVAFIVKDDSSRVLGRIVKVLEKRVDLNMEVTEKGVETNVSVTVVDNNGKEHSGMLFVS